MRLNEYGIKETQTLRITKGFATLCQYESGWDASQTLVTL